MFKFNPITSKLDHVENFNQGMGVWEFSGWTDDAADADPGTGKAIFDDTDGDYTLLISYTDKNGYDFYMNFFSLYLAGASYYDFFINLRSKSNPTKWIKLFVLDVADPGVPLRWKISVGVMAITTYEEDGAYPTVEFDAGEDITLSIDLAFNPDYIGTLGTQDSDDVSITGGSIGSVTAAFTNGKLLLPVKETTGDPASPIIGQIYWNTNDKLIRGYDGVAWHTIFDHS